MAAITGNLEEEHPIPNAISRNISSLSPHSNNVIMIWNIDQYAGRDDGNQPRQYDMGRIRTQEDHDYHQNSAQHYNDPGVLQNASYGPGMKGPSYPPPQYNHPEEFNYNRQQPTKQYDSHRQEEQFAHLSPYNPTGGYQPSVMQPQQRVPTDRSFEPNGYQNYPNQYNYSSTPQQPQHSQPYEPYPPQQQQPSYQINSNPHANDIYQEPIE